MLVLVLVCGGARSSASMKILEDMPGVPQGGAFIARVGAVGKRAWPRSRVRAGPGPRF